MDMTQIRKEQVERRSRRAFDNYTIRSPIRTGTALCVIEALQSQKPFTKDGDVYGIVDHAQQTKDMWWWSAAIAAIGATIVKEFPGRGITFFTLGQQRYIFGPAERDAAAV